MEGTMEIKDLCRLIDENKDTLFSLLSSLIKIDSENFGDHGNEEACAKYVHSLCEKMGLNSQWYSPLSLENFLENPDYFPGRGLENRYNVSAVWQGSENINELMLMGHIDTVVIGDRSNWNADPLSGEIKDGKVFGRGACDDKYAVAAALFLIQLLKEAGFKPKKNLVFAAYCDEELGGSHGALAAVLKDPCNRIVNMDGKEDQIWHCASGGQVTTYRYHTVDTVDSAEKAAMAIPVVIDGLKEFAKRRREELEANPFYAGTIIPGTSMRYTEVRAGNNGADLGVGELQFGYYTDKTKDEIYAEFAQIEIELNEKLAPMGIQGDGFIPYTRFFHYGYCDPGCKAIQDMLDAAQEATGSQPKVCGSCLSDLSIILKYSNADAYGFGAGRNFYDEGGAHQPNEYIECDKLVEYTKTIGAYILKVLG